MKKNIYLSIIIAVIACLYSFNSSALTWTQRANVGSIPRAYACGFSISTTGYIGTGQDSSGYSRADFWAWDQLTNTWTQKADLTGGARAYACGFSIGQKGYIMCGLKLLGDTTDVWEYTPATNAWVAKAAYPGAGRENIIGLSIGTKGYVGTGGSIINPPANDWWEFNPTANTWTAKASMPGQSRVGAAGFIIASNCYVGTGMHNLTYLNDFYEFNTLSNTWTIKTAFGGSARYLAVGFNIGNLGYFATGDDGSTKSDCWEYSIGSNSWTQIASLSIGRASAVGFGIGTKGYIGTGFNTPPQTLLKDFWELGSPAGIDNVPVKDESINVFPNPFTEYISISYSLEKSSPVKIELLDLTGKSVCVLSDEANQNPGEYSSKWNLGESNLSNGMYILTINAGENVYTRRVNLVK